MEKFSLLIICLGAFILIRALSFVFMQIDFVKNCEKFCIERIAKEQKSCDKLIMAYHSFIMCVGTWISIIGFALLFKMNNFFIINIICFIILFIAYNIYFFLKQKYLIGNDLPNFYNNMIDYRSKQKVVTKDNDNEVNFIRSYRKIQKHFYFINFWMISSIIYLIIVY